MLRCIPDYELDLSRHEIVGGPWSNGCQGCGSSSSSVSSARSSSSSSSLSSASSPSSSSSSSDVSVPDPYEYICANDCAPTIAAVWPPVAPGHYQTQAECLNACGACYRLNLFIEGCDYQQLGLPGQYDRRLTTDLAPVGLPYADGWRTEDGGPAGNIIAFRCVWRQPNDPLPPLPALTPMLAACGSLCPWQARPVYVYSAQLSNDGLCEQCATGDCAPFRDTTYCADLASGTGTLPTGGLVAQSSSSSNARATLANLTTANTVGVAWLVVAGGGAGGGWNLGSGGGAGGYLSGSAAFSTGQQYSVVVGGGGTVAGYDTWNGVGANGSNSVLSWSGGTLASSIGGGGGGGETGFAAGNGGSGGGRALSGSNVGTGIAGQGHDGGCIQYLTDGAGGGGAGAPANYRQGGNGKQWLDGNYYAGGGSGGSTDYISGSALAGGLGGGGTGGGYPYSSGGAGNVSTGGGGGGPARASTSYPQTFAGPGGSGIVILRAAVEATATSGSPTVTQEGGVYVYTFTGSGSITF